MHKDTNRDDEKQADLSKSQNAQQPRGEADKARDNQRDDQSTPPSSSDKTGQPGMADYGSAERADALAQNRSGIEQSAASDQKQSGGFVGSDSQSDTSSDLVDSERSDPPAGK